MNSSTHFKEKSLHIIHPVVDMKKTPPSEVVSQALFGEQVTLAQESEGWGLIATPDGYSGWVPLHALAAGSYAPNRITCRNSVPVYGKKNIKRAPLFLLPYGVGLQGIEDEEEWTVIKLPQGEIAYVKRANLAARSSLAKEELCAWSCTFLGLPYLWGGRSSFGFDCSGFVQMLYARMGCPLPRDAADQFRDPRLQRTQRLKSGDLIFWGEQEAKIRHVGMFLGEDRFIHATAYASTPWLCVSRMDDPLWSDAQGALYRYRVCMSLQGKTG